MQSVEKALRVKSSNTNSDWTSFAEALDNYADLSLPYPLSEVHVVYERVQVYSDLFDLNKSNNLMLDFLCEVPGVPVLFYDGVLSGRNAPHLAIGGENVDMSTATTWETYMLENSKLIVYAQTELQFGVVLAPLKSFASV